MKKFKFHLETILKLRQKSLDEELGKLSIIAGIINAYRNRILSNNSEISLVQTNFENIVKAGGDLLQFYSYEAYIKRLYIENDDLELAIAKKDKDLSDARERVKDARKDVRIIEILKERKLAEFNQVLLKIEKSEVEEFNNIRAAQKEGETRNENRGTIFRSVDEEDYIDDGGPDSDGPAERVKTEFDKLGELYGGKAKS
ncbi:MAG: flagellar export protein FliJ [Leptospira sp.]|nr:flagellar export protein FliJ [Leptospira sp.]